MLSPHGTMVHVIDDVTLLGLRVLREVAGTGSFSAAAVELGYTQSAVSRQMRALETAVGEPLFERGRRGVELTPAGRLVLAGAGRVLTELETTTAQLAGRRDRLAGRLPIGAFPTACAVLVPRVVAAMQRDHPGLDILVDEASTPVLLRRLRSRRLDVAVVATEADDPSVADLARHRLPVVGMRLAVPVTHRFAGRREVTVDELRDEPWIVGFGAPGDPQFGPWSGIEDPRIAHAVRQWTTRLGLVAAGLGITVLPGAMAPTVPSGVAVVRVDDPAHVARGSLAVTRADPDARTCAALDAVIDQARRIRDELAS
jgi:DNA-binding transcriptional LysR family regulator